MKRNCIHIEQALTAYLAGDLDPRAAARVEKHLAGCPDCRAELDSLKATLDSLLETFAADAGESLRLSPDRRTRVLNAARARAAHAPTFAERLGRVLDAGFGGTAARYAFLRAFVPVAATLLVVVGLASMLVPSLKQANPRCMEVVCSSGSAPLLARFEDAPADGMVLLEKRESADSLERHANELESLMSLEDLGDSGIKAHHGGGANASTESTRSTEPAKSDRSDSDGLEDAYTAVVPADAPAPEGGLPAAAPSTPPPPAAPAPAAKPQPPAESSGLASHESKGIPAPRVSADGRMGFGERKAKELEKKRAERDAASGAPTGGQNADLNVGASLATSRIQLNGETSASDAPALRRKSDEAQEAAKRKDAEPAAESLFVSAGFNPYIETARQPFSTFAIDVDTASYTLTRRFLLEGRLPPPESVRTEEIVNFLEYHYSPPAGDAAFAVHALAAPSPFRPGQQLLRLGVKARRLGREENRRAVLTFAVDTSGSMSSPERLGLVRQALRLLVEKLSPDDLVALVQFDTQARLVLDYTRAAEKERILKAIDGLQTSGSTNLEEGMRLAYQCARRAFKPGASNRVLILSDGAANLGGSAEEILAVVADSRRQGVFCSVYGVGRGGLNDVMLETLANKGDGAYTYLDSLDEARRVFVDELAATLNTVAADVKIQVEFDAARVAQYRQIGYENRRLRKEQFRDDAVDAGEVGSGQSVTALYDITLAPGSKGPLGVVRIRYRDLRTGRVAELEAPLPETLLAPRFEEAEPAFQLAACAAEFAEHLRGSPYAAGADLRDIETRLRPAAAQYALDPRVQELLRLVTTAASLKRGE